MNAVNPDIIKYASMFLRQIPELLLQEMEMAYKQYEEDFMEEMRLYPVAALMATTQRNIDDGSNNTTLQSQLKWKQGIIDYIGYGNRYEAYPGFGWNAGELNTLKRSIEDVESSQLQEHYDAWLFTKGKLSQKFGFINWMDNHPFEVKS